MASIDPKNETNEQAPTQQFAIQRIYVKDLSFEAPNVPETFQKEWKPELNLDINTGSKKVDDKGEFYETELRLTVTVKNEGKTAFLAEVKQAGIFHVLGFEADQLDQALGIFCPTVLYPYARETISDLVSRASFPQLILAPVNFEALYAQHKAQAAEKEEA